MADKKGTARLTINDLRKNHPDYYNGLHFKCRNCLNIMSGAACDMCENFDMFSAAFPECGNVLECGR